jgi:hypothetical protein
MMAMQSFDDINMLDLSQSISEQSVRRTSRFLG